MHRFNRALIAAVLTILFALPAAAQQQPDPDSPRYKGVVALDEFIGSDGDEAIEEFIENRIAASVRESMGDAKLAETLTAIRTEFAGAQMRGGRPIGPLSAELVLDGPGGAEMSIAFELDDQDSDRFILIRSPEHTVEAS